MLPRLSPLAVAALLIAIGMGLIHFVADEGSRRGLDYGEQAPPPCQLDESYPGDQEMERRWQVLWRRIAAKEQLVRELLDGRLTLMQAAVRYRDIEELMRLPCDPPRSAANDAAEGERLCRVVITMANDMLEERPLALAADATARLEAELARHRNQNGIVRLPD